MVVKGMVKEVEAGGEATAVGVQGSSEHFSEGDGCFRVSKKQRAQIGEKDGRVRDRSGELSRGDDDGWFGHGGAEGDPEGDSSSSDSLLKPTLSASEKRSPAGSLKATKVRLTGVPVCSVAARSLQDPRSRSK